MSLVDIVYVSLVAFSLAIVLPVIYGVYSQIYPKMKTELGTEASSVMQKSEVVFSKFDLIFSFVFVGLLLVSFVLAAFLPTNPIFIFADIIFMVVSFLVFPILANTYLNFATQYSVVNIELQFPYTFFILRNYPTILMVAGFSMFVILAIRWRWESE